MDYGKRRFLIKSYATIGSATLASLLTNFSLIKSAAASNSSQSASASPFGPIYPSDDLTTGLPLLSLPKGFSYRSISWAGDLMDDGAITPNMHDGMTVLTATKNNSDQIVLMRNHELIFNQRPFPTIVGNPETTPIYDDFIDERIGITNISGGTTALTIENGKLIDARGTLAGTVANCAGGPTPWGSWLTCEEAIVRGSMIGAKDHGYVFEVPAPSDGLASAKPIVDMGLMKHEAIAIDPKTGYCYLTEDSHSHSGFYRFTPNDNSKRLGSLEKGGRLEMLKVKDQDNKDLRNTNVSDYFEVEWVPVKDTDRDPEAFTSYKDVQPAIFGKGKSGPYLCGEELRAARFDRLEGCVYHNGNIYFVDTRGGEISKGIVWVYEPFDDSSKAQGILRAIFVSHSADMADNPDNIAITPHGGIVVCEDGGGSYDEITGDLRIGTRMLGINNNGTSFVIAENNIIIDSPIRHRNVSVVNTGDYRTSEWAGVTFDISGKYMFVSIQDPGVTFIIEGPWEKGFS